MKVYILNADSNRYRSLYLANADDVERFDPPLAGEAIGPSWSPLPVWFPADEENLLPGDFPQLQAVGEPVFSRRALEVFGDLLEGRGELLPLSGVDDYVLFNVTRVPDVLDRQESELAYFDDGGVMDIDHYAFDPDRVANETIFRLPPIPDLYRYVTGPFVQRAQDAGLAGFAFDRIVWSDEADARIGWTSPEPGRR